ncbi:MAG: manganese efflux pump [Deltaproteobacteria bacterium]|nr:manganese efflux pump [Deltaproteobacteria bacterium]
MSLVNIIGIAIGLAMDAFAVSIASSVLLQNVSPRQTFRLSFHFGFFQFAMPVIGWLLGSTFARWVMAFDHWIAFGLLLLIGSRMIYESLTRPEDEKRRDPSRWPDLVILSVATSIDALAVGVSFAMLDVTIWLPCVIIGLVAAGMTLVGLRIGARLGTRFGRRMEILGGIVLIGIGARILLQHLL